MSEPTHDSTHEHGDHGDHGGGHDGGHELEAINAGLLFRLFIGLSLVTFISAVMVIQWFYQQRSELLDERAQEVGSSLGIHRDAMEKASQGLDTVVKDVLADPALMAADPAPAGWIHPDDLKTGGGANPK